MDLATVGTDVEKVIATEEQLHNRIAELAAQVDADYKDKKVLLVGVLKGDRKSTRLNSSHRT